MDKRSLYGYSERGSSWPFTYLCYDFASLDLIDGIAINLRISRGREDDQDESTRQPRPETRKPVPVYIHVYTRIHTYICMHARVYTTVCKRASGIETNSNEYRLGESRNVVVSYTAASRWEFQKTEGEGAVIDGIPPSFERVQLFTGDRYTTYFVVVH